MYYAANFEQRVLVKAPSPPIWLSTYALTTVSPAVILFYSRLPGNFFLSLLFGLLSLIGAGLILAPKTECVADE